MGTHTHTHIVTHQHTRTHTHASIHLTAHPPTVPTSTQFLLYPCYLLPPVTCYHLLPSSNLTMPNTGMINNHTYKCEECRHSFQKIWLPTNACCRISKIQDRTNDALQSARFSRHSRHKANSPAAEPPHPGGLGSSLTTKDSSQAPQRNKLAPFKTLGKPTCGFNFSRETDNRKKKFGIMPSNLVKWRSEKIERIPIS